MFTLKCLRRQISYCEFFATSMSEKAKKKKKIMNKNKRERARNA